ncbi:MAG: transposase zinc-binding domain-containing protein, partial [Deltaproteobacteria bacterium]|nr:transposase zinc-binding domain-containing protein [Deltaproteobacteria bacterium]
LFSYLACGIPAHGFALLRCDACDGSHVVPFSCKGRGFCPSCALSRLENRHAVM